MSTLNIVSGFATITTIVLYLTGWPVARRIISSKSSANVSYIPYACGICSTVLWLKYGLMIDDTTLIGVNAIGFLLNCYYFGVCYFYSADQASMRRALLVSAGYFYSVLVYVKYFTTSYGQAVNHLGIAGCLAVIVMFGSPLTSLKTVLRTKSTETMVFSLCLMNFVVSVSWTLYGYLLGDLFIELPNSIGALLALGQLLLFVKYPSSGGPGHVYDLAARFV